MQRQNITQWQIQYVSWIGRKPLPRNWHISVLDPIPLYCNNQVAIHIATLPVIMFFIKWQNIYEMNCHFIHSKWNQIKLFLYCIIKESTSRHIHKSPFKRSLSQLYVTSCELLICTLQLEGECQDYKSNCRRDYRRIYRKHYWRDLYER